MIKERVAHAYIAELDKAHVFPQPIVTKLEPLTGFYPAEDYHQDFLVLHPSHPYIVFNDLPKVRELEAAICRRIIAICRSPSWRRRTSPANNFRL